MDSYDGLGVQIKAFDGRPIVVVQGEIDLTTTPSLAEAFRSATTPDVSEVLVDLSDVTFMDSTGVGVLVTAARRVALRIAGSSPYINRVLEAAGLDDTLDAGDNLHDTSA